MRRLRDYQQRAVTHLYENEGAVAVMPMGAGKTAIALHAIDEMLRERQISGGIVLAPKRVAEITWPDELKEWPELRLDLWVITGSPSKREYDLTYPDTGIKVVGVDNTQWLCTVLAQVPEDNPLFDLLVIDEISRFKDPTGARYKALMKLIPKFRNIWGLTGTPRPNSDLDLFAPANIVSKGKLWGRSFYQWRQKNFYPTDYQGYNWTCLPGTSERLWAEFGDWSFRLDDKDMPELPEVNVVVDKIDLPPAARKAYDTMEAKLFAQLGLKTGEPPEHTILASSSAVATGKLAQIAQGFVYDGEAKVPRDLHDLKIDWLKEIVDTLDGEPLIVFYDFQHDQDRLRAAFPLMVFLQDFYGLAATAIVAQWNRGELPLLALHPASAGHGLNLQHGGSKMAWYSLPWSAELFDQSRSRLIRPGQKNTVTEFHCVARKTVDEMKRARVIDKISAQQAFKDYLDAV